MTAHRLNFKVRLDAKLHATIKAAAAANQRSLNAEICSRLQASTIADRLADHDARLERIEGHLVL